MIQVLRELPSLWVIPDNEIELILQTLEVIWFKVEPFEETRFGKNFSIPYKHFPSSMGPFEVNKAMKTIAQLHFIGNLSSDENALHFEFPSFYRKSDLEEFKEGINERYILLQKRKGSDTAKSVGELEKKQSESTNNPPKRAIRLVEESRKGFLQFHKNGKKYFVGMLGSRGHKLIQSLCEPHFGVHKTLEAVFEAMRQKKDSQDARLMDPSLKKTRVKEIIDFAIKDLQKTKKVPGKLIYKREGNLIWLEEI